MGRLMYNDIDYSGSEVVELTQADYDALPSSKYYDDITYLISDVYSPSSTKNMGLGECYSTSEKMVGCWIDGKPLYQITVNFGTISAGGYKTIDLTSLNIQTVTKFNGVGVLNDSTVPIPTSHTTTMGNQIFCRFNNDKTLGVYPGNQMGLVNCYITISYTKTTDVAGSGNWTPEGVPAVHYDDSEKIIGTWFGSALYEKTISMTSGIVVGSNYGYITLDSNIIVRDIQGYVYRASHKTVDKFNGYISQGQLFCTIRTNQIEYKIDSAFTNIEEMTFTIRYTKTL